MSVSQWITRSLLIATLAMPVLKVSRADDKSDSNKGAVESKPTDRFAVPEGDVAALVKFIDGIENARPTSAVEAAELRSKGMSAMTTAAEKILALETDKTSAAYKRARRVLIMSEIQKLPSASADAQRKLLDEVLAMVGETPVFGRPEAGMALNVANTLERIGNVPLAIEALTAFAPLFSKSDDEVLKGYGDKLLGSARRLKLPGNVMEISGKLVNGEQFDLKSLRGKVVLVDYWATWCGPCIAELPNVKENYVKYHGKGFEVVGISLDKDRAKLEGFLHEKEIPWVCLFEDNAGWDHSMASYYGIMSIPAAILLDKDGKVVTMRARGSELTKQLEELLGAGE